MIKKEVLLEWMEDNQIKYFGFVNDIRETIAKSDCIVLPSYREGMPRVVLEAMSMEKPVIVTDVAGCRETVEDSINGFLVELKSVNSLEKAMLKFLNLSNERRIEMGRKGRLKAEKEFNSEKISHELYDFISQVYFCSK